MVSPLRHSPLILQRWGLRSSSTTSALPPQFMFHPEVRDALLAGDRPVLAFETTIATHGLPHPQRVSVPLNLENIARSYGCVPATISVLHGRVHIGTTAEQLEELVTQPDVLKLSRRDLALAAAQSKSGGTTVASTMRLSAMAGIKFFATGGIGGVHRNGENSLDVSADLLELASSPVAVVCAGPKSILDIPRTLEYLETHSVPVATWQSIKFPAFYAQDSGLKSPSVVNTADDAAAMYRQNEFFGRPSGTLFAVPIPRQAGERAKPIQQAVEQAVKESDANGMSRKGKESTPWLLARVKELTGGASVESNIALIENNTRIASQIAAAYYRNNGTPSFQPSITSVKPEQDRTPHSVSDASTGASARASDLIIVGAAALDITAQSRSEDVQLGCTSPGTVTMNPGGVARNVAEAANQLGCKPLLLAALGEDAFGNILRDDCRSKGIALTPLPAGKCQTAVATPTLDGKGDLVVGIAAMEIAEHLDHEALAQNLKHSPGGSVIAFDANISSTSMKLILEHCKSAKKPTFLEPTSIKKCSRILETGSFPLLDHITPNKAELNQLWTRVQETHFETEVYTEQLLSFNLDSSFAESLSRSLPGFLHQEGHAQRAVRLLPLFGTIWLKLGSEGCLVATRAPVSKDWARPGTAVGPPGVDGLCVVLRHYPALPIETSEIKSVIGAGDNFAAGILSHLTQDHNAHRNSVSLDLMVDLGQRAALAALRSNYAVNSELHRILVV